MKAILGRDSKILGRFPIDFDRPKSKFCANEILFEPIMNGKKPYRFLCTGPTDHDGHHEAMGSTGIVYAFWDDDRETD